MRSTLLLALLMNALVRVAPGQEPARIALRASDGRLAEEFSRLVSIRELSDGRVLLSDNRDNRVAVADFRANRVAAVGRVGSGPAEFRPEVRPVQPLGSAA